MTGHPGNPRWKRSSPRDLRPDAGRLAASDRHFTFGGGDSKAELDEIIRQSLALWAA